MGKLRIACTLNANINGFAEHFNWSIKLTAFGCFFFLQIAHLKIVYIREWDRDGGRSTCKHIAREKHFVRPDVEPTKLTIGLKSSAATTAELAQSGSFTRSSG